MHQATTKETPLTSKKEMGMIHSSRNLARWRSLNGWMKRNDVTDLEKERKRPWRTGDKE